MPWKLTAGNDQLMSLLCCRGSVHASGVAGDSEQLVPVLAHVAPYCQVPDFERETCQQHVMQSGLGQQAAAISIIYADGRNFFIALGHNAPEYSPVSACEHGTQAQSAWADTRQSSSLGPPVLLNTFTPAFPMSTACSIVLILGAPGACGQKQHAVQAMRRNTIPTGQHVLGLSMRTSAPGGSAFRAPGGVVGGAGDLSTPLAPMAAASSTCSSLCAWCRLQAPQHPGMQF